MILVADFIRSEWQCSGEFLNNLFFVSLHYAAFARKVHLNTLEDSSREVGKVHIHPF